MSDTEPLTRSALGEASFDGIVTLRAVPPRGALTLRADLGAAAVKKALKAAGLTLPDPLLATGDAERAALWMSPDEVLILVPEPDRTEAMSAVQAALDGQHVLVTDTTDARVHFALEGADLREVLAKLAPLDMSAHALPVGAVRRTRMAQVAAGIWMQSPERAEVFCFRSVAQYMFDLLRHAADPDARVGYF